WLLRTGLVDPSEVEAHEPFVLKKSTALEFENGVRIARLLQWLSAEGSETLDTLKDVHTPVAKLYNWNLLLPVMRKRQLDVDQDMKVLIVAGDIDIVADLLGQLHRMEGGSPSLLGQARGAGRLGEREKSELRPQTLADAVSVVQFLAFCCAQQLDTEWPVALDLATNNKKLQLLLHGRDGNFAPTVRWYKLIFAHCKLLAKLCDSDGVNLALCALGGGLSSSHSDVALWSSRVLCRLAADLAAQGQRVPMWQWFSGSGSGCQGLTDAWKAHPQLHAAGALMPLALHLAGEKLHLFLSTVLPRFLSSHALYLGFVLELIPLLAGSKGSHDFMLRSGALSQLLQRALRVARSPSEGAETRGLAMEMLTQLWISFTRELESITFEPHNAASQPTRSPVGEELEEEVITEKGNPSDASTQLITELKNGCRDSRLELQLTSHMCLFQLLDEFAVVSHPCAPYIFNILAFSLIENHHEPVLRQFLARNMQHSLQQQPYIPVGVLLKPLIKQATLYGYCNTDFDFYLTLGKHQRLGLRHGLLLLQFLGKVCLNDALHGRVATIPFLVLIERFHDSDLLHDFLEMFTEQALASLLPENDAAKTAPSSTIRSTLCIELVAKLLHLPHAQIIRRVTPAVQSACRQYSALARGEHPGLAALLAFAERNDLSPPAARAAASSSPAKSPADKPSPAEKRAQRRRQQPVGRGGGHGSPDIASPERKGFSSADSPASQGAKGRGGHKQGKPKDISPPRARPSVGAASRAKISEPTSTRQAAKRAKVEARVVAVIPPSADEKELRAKEKELSELIRAIDEKLEGGRHDKLPPGMSPLDRREHEIEHVKAARTAKAERSRLEEERGKLRAARIKRRMRAKYDAKLREARVVGEAKPRLRGRREVSKLVEEELSAAEQRRRRGERNRLDRAKRVGPAEIAEVERQLREAEDPNLVAIPPGYKVEVSEEEGESCLIPPGQLGLGDALEASLAALDGICYGAVGVHLLQPVGVKHTKLKLVPVGGPLKPAARPSAHSSSPQPRRPRDSPERSRGSPVGQRKHTSLDSRPKQSSADTRRRRESPDMRRRVPAPPSARSVPSRSPPPRKPSAPPAQTERRPQPSKQAVSLPPVKTKPRHVVPEPPASTNPMRADVQKYQKELARIKREEEANEKLRARRAESKVKLEAWHAEKAAKDAEKKRELEEAEAAKQAEVERKRERERKRQAMLKRKVDEYHKEHLKGADAFGNSGGVSPDSASSPDKGKKPSKPNKKSPAHQPPQSSLPEKGGGEGGEHVTPARDSPADAPARAVASEGGTEDPDPLASEGAAVEAAEAPPAAAPAVEPAIEAHAEEGDVLNAQMASEAADANPAAHTRQPDATADDTVAAEAPAAENNA
ncbi:MAG: hypothetical protein SGPRY_005688, partial [Prymnesium sp.]